MSHTPHELHAEFPADVAMLRELKVSDPHYRSLSEQYHEVNREIHRIEAEVDPATDARLEDLKKQRLSMLDEVAEMLAKAKTAA